MQGQVFLGDGTMERKYVFAARDRMDETFDRIRAVRDRRFKYIRNYYPEHPYLLWVPYRNRHPAMQDMWELFAAGKLDGAQELVGVAEQRRVAVVDVAPGGQRPPDLSNLPLQGRDVSAQRAKLLMDSIELGEDPLEGVFHRAHLVLLV
jgi:hypothetical protein